MMYAQFIFLDDDFLTFGERVFVFFWSGKVARWFVLPQSIMDFL
jgi:hypothetical protein